MKDVTLVIIFNHKYNKNIPILDELYKNRFSDIVYIVPFYKSGEVDDSKYEIIDVYESSYSYQGYVAQAYYRLRKHTSKYYMFIGDDLILNPKIDENNFMEYFNIDVGESYSTEVCKINEPFGKYRWLYSRVYHNFMCFTDNRFVNFRDEIPSREDAFEISKLKGYRDFSIDKKFYFRNKGIKGRLKSLIERRRTIPKEAEYPLFGGYSDLFIIANKDFADFAHISGVFSAMEVFAEIAIPTAMVLSCERIVQQKDTKFERGDIWGMDNKQAFGQRYGFSLDKLLDDWPENLLFIHPIKLSQWKN